MASTQEFGREGLVDQLIGFDQDVAVRFPGYRFEMLVVGGGALLLLGVSDRPTSDIDVLSVPSQLHELMAAYHMNGRVAAHEFNFAYNRDDRRQRIDLPTRAVTCYVASLEDIVAAKLCSPRDKDELDIRGTEVLAALDWDRLAAIAAEMSMTLNDRQLAEFRHSYEIYLKESKP